MQLRNRLSRQPLGQCTAPVLIDGIFHHIELALLSSFARGLILWWDILSAAAALISRGD